MSGRTAYLDTSAFVTLLVVEPHSDAFAEAVTQWPERASSVLLRAETARALARSGRTDLLAPARQLMAALHLVRIDEPLLDRAGDLPPVALRTLDAVHLAAALSIGSDLGVLFTYEERLAEAARAQGVRVESPA